MSRARLLSTVAATLVLSATAAFAQAPAKDSTPANPAPAPAAQQSAPAEKAAPSMKAGQPNAETHKAGPAAQNKPGAGDHAADKGAMDKAAEQKAPLKPSDANGSSTVKPSATNGQGSAAGAAKLSTEQRTKITTVFQQHRVEPAKLDISVSVGTRVPDSVHYYPIPEEVVVIYPEWRGYDYIYVGDQIVILDPRTHEIVAIIEA